MNRSHAHRVTLIAGTMLALGAGIAQAQAPAPPTPISPPALRATTNAEPSNANHEVSRLAMRIRGHDIEIVVTNGVPTYRVDGDWQGKNRWRNTTDGGFIFDDPDGKPLLTLTPRQAADMGLVRIERPAHDAKVVEQVGAGVPNQRAFRPPTPFDVHGSATIAVHDSAINPAHILLIAPPRAVLGITMLELPEALASHLAIARDSAVMIGSVIPGQAAEMAGLKAMDVLVWIGDEGKRASFDAVREVLSAKSPGDEIELGIIRAGKPMNLKATLMKGDGLQTSLELPVNLTSDLRRAEFDGAILAMDSERAALFERAKQIDSQIVQTIEESTSLNREEALQLARQIHQMTSEFKDLIERSKSINSQVDQLLLDRRRATPVPPSPPQTSLHGRSVGRTGVARSSTEATAVVLDDAMVTWFVQPGSGEQSLTALAAELRNQTQQLRSIERSRLVSEAGIEKRLERIERLLEELAARQR